MEPEKYACFAIFENMFFFYLSVGNVNIFYVLWLKVWLKESVANGQSLKLPAV